VPSSSHEKAVERRAGEERRSLPHLTSRLHPTATSEQPACFTLVAVEVLESMTHKRFVIRAFVTLVCAVALAGASALAFQGPEKPGEPAAQAPSEKQADAEKNQGKSLLTNGGFEEGDSKGDAPDGWKTGGIAFQPLRLVEAPGNVTYQWDRKVAHQGSASLHLTKKVRYFLPPWGQWFQEVKRTSTSPCIKVGAFVKAKKATKAILNVQFLDGNGQCFAQSWAVYIGAKKDRDPPVTHDWKRYEGIVEIPQGTEKFNIAAQICGPGDVWFDDIEAEYTNAPATDATAP
jgi:hypothetical protein